MLERYMPVSNFSALLRQISLKNHLAVDALKEGTATIDDVQNLSELHNFVDRLMSIGFGMEYKDVLFAGREAILAIAERTPQNAKNFAALEAEVTALAEMIDLHDAQTEVITLQDVRRAEEFCQKNGKLVNISFGTAPQATAE